MPWRIRSGWRRWWKTPEAHPTRRHVREPGAAWRNAYLDSAGMLIAADGSSKQRGHGQPPERFAAIRRGAVSQRIGRACTGGKCWTRSARFDESFFLYCEDTDLGLRARWAGWECRYVAGAVVEHRYSHSAGRASPLKAYYVERNRLYTVVKNFPLRMLLRAPFAALARYFWHLISMLTGEGRRRNSARRTIRRAAAVSGVARARRRRWCGCRVCCGSAGAISEDAADHLGRVSSDLLAARIRSAGAARGGGVAELA